MTPLIPEHQIAEILLETGAVELRPHKPFTWASGWQSPIYCDNRKTLTHTRARMAISEALKDAIKVYFPETALIAGVATAGIPQASILADRLDLPLVYVRSKAKGHGRENLIEGEIMKGKKTLVLEDLVSTGGSSLSACNALTKAGFEVIGLLSTFTYGFDVANKAFMEAGVPFHSLSTYGTLVKLATDKGIIEPKDLPTLAAWRAQPDSWKP